MGFLSILRRETEKECGLGVNEMDIMVTMCESCVRKLGGRPFKSATRRSSASFRYCVACKCFNKAAFVVHLRLPERKVRE